MPFSLMSIRNLWLVLFILFSSSGISALAVAEEEEVRRTITVYNWSEYIPSGVLEDFTRRTGIDVDYQTYDSNKEMYDRIKRQSDGEVDVIVPSGYYVSKMQKEGLLLPLQLYRIGSLKQLDSGLLNQAYDPGNKYSLPYVWGSTGIAVNTSRIDPKESITSWKDLWREDWKGRLLLTDDLREVFHLGLRINGYSTNSRDAFEIKDAFRSLSALMPLVGTVTDESPHEALLDGRADIGVLWSGEAVLAQAKNPRIRYIFPEEGAAFWTDNFAIPVGSDNPAEAHSFISFMLSRRIAIRTVEELGYATSNLVARKGLPERIRNNPIIFPNPNLLASGEFQMDPGDQAMRLMRNHWQKLRKEIQDAE